MRFFDTRHFILRTAAAGLGCILLLTGCSQPVAEQPASSAVSSQTEQTVSEPARFSIAVRKDSFNPYLTDDSLTRQCAGLLFDTLTRISPSMELELRLASQVDCNGYTVTVHLRSGCRFADGSSITAADVAASIEAARGSSQYAARLSNVTHVQAEEASVVLTLAQPDSLFAYLLDLPVMKADETGLACPTASGRYTYGAAGDTLVRNGYSSFPADGPDTIYLTPVSNDNELISALALGTVSICQADGVGFGTVGTTQSTYRSNNLLFLGVNAAADNPLCDTAEGRALLSQTLSRRELAGRDAGSTPALGTLNPFYPCVTGKQVLQAEADSSSLEKTLISLGYSYQEDTGLYQTAQGETISVDILVYTGNPDRLYTANLLRQQWSSRGIQVTLTQTDDFDTYLQKIQSRQFELYIGEMKLYNNMDLSPFWTGGVCYGVAYSENLLEAYARFKVNSEYAGEFEEAFAQTMPYIPLLWRGGVAVSHRSVSGVQSSVSDLYYSLSNLSVAN